VGGRRHDSSSFREDEPVEVRASGTAITDTLPDAIQTVAFGAGSTIAYADRSRERVVVRDYVAKREVETKSFRDRAVDVRQLHWSLDRTQLGLIADNAVLVWGTGAAPRAFVRFAGQGAVVVRGDGTVAFIGDGAAARSLVACRVGATLYP